MRYLSFAENFGPSADQFFMKNWSIVGPKFQLRTNFRKKFDPGDENSMENWC